MKEIDSEIPKALLEMMLAFEVTSQTLAALRDSISTSFIKNKTSLILPNEICHSVYFIVSGGFVCRYYDERLPEGKTIYFYLDELHPFMACVDSFFTRTPTKCELQAIRDAEVVSLRMDALTPLMETDANLFRFFHSVVLRALLEEHEFRLKLIAFTSYRLYQHLIQHFPAIIREVPSRYIAEFMGITPEWLTKLKSRANKMIDS